MKVEIWKDIPDYEGYYQISTLGQIRAVERSIRQNKGDTVYERIMPSRIIKQRITNAGYCFVCLSKDNKASAFTTHRLMAITFMGKWGDGLQINHKDGNKLNNELDNLELVTQSENVRHSYRELGHKILSRKVKCVDTGEIYGSIREAGEKTGINRCCISQCILGHFKTAGGYKWVVAD